MTLLTSPSPSKPSHRFLYRGALSLPDSHILLDGLTFYANSNDPALSPDKNPLLDNPLALALESMRRVPSLRFIGEVKLSEVYLDETPPMCLEVHPLATLTKLYFEQTFCLEPMDADISSIGIKVALGDTDGPETTYILIYAKHTSSTHSPLPPLLNILSQPSTSTSPTPPPIELLVSRITTQPRIISQPAIRLPRPDDPVPRSDNLLRRTALERSRTLSGKEQFSQLDAARKVNKPKRSNSVLGLGIGDPFSVPEMPPPLSRASSSTPGLDMEGGGGPESQLERANKNIIKQATQSLLTSPPYRMKKSDAEFKEVFNPIYRGVAFAMRKYIKETALDLDVVNKLVKAHAGMYVGKKGRSGNS